MHRLPFLHYHKPSLSSPYHHFIGILTCLHHQNRNVGFFFFLKCHFKTVFRWRPLYYFGSDAYLHIKVIRRQCKNKMQVYNCTTPLNLCMFRWKALTSMEKRKHVLLQRVKPASSWADASLKSDCFCTCIFMLSCLCSYHVVHQELRYHLHSIIIKNHQTLTFIIIHLNNILQSIDLRPGKMPGKAPTCGTPHRFVTGLIMQKGP